MTYNAKVINIKWIRVYTFFLTLRAPMTLYFTLYYVNLELIISFSLTICFEQLCATATSDRPIAHISYFFDFTL